MQEIMQVYKDLGNGRDNDGKQDDWTGLYAAHDNSKGNDCQNDGKNETGCVRSESSPTCSAAVDSLMVHLHYPQQVNDGKNGYPHYIQKVPKHTEPSQSRLHRYGQSFGEDLTDHYRHPDQS